MREWRWHVYTGMCKVDMVGSHCVARGAQLPALWWPRGGGTEVGVGRRQVWEGGLQNTCSWIHVVAEQQLTQYCKAIILKFLKVSNIAVKLILLLNFYFCFMYSGSSVIRYMRIQDCCVLMNWLIIIKCTNLFLSLLCLLLYPHWYSSGAVFAWYLFLNCNLFVSLKCFLETVQVCSCFLKFALHSTSLG